MSAGSPWPVVWMLAAASSRSPALASRAADPRRGLLVLEQVGAVQALLQGVDDRHRRRLSREDRGCVVGYGAGHPLVAPRSAGAHPRRIRPRVLRRGRRGRGSSRRWPTPTGPAAPVLRSRPGHGAVGGIGTAAAGVVPGGRGVPDHVARREHRDRRRLHGIEQRAREDPEADDDDRRQHDRHRDRRRGRRPSARPGRVPQEHRLEHAHVVERRDHAVEQAQADQPDQRQPARRRLVRAPP